MSSPRVILLHGFNVFDGGKRTVGKLRPYFEAAGFRVKQPPYGWVGLLGLRYANAKVTPVIAEMIEPDDIVVGHSNGCAIAAAALDLGAPFSQMVLINPALDRDHPFSITKELRAIHVWHSPSDSPVKWAKLLPGHAWGDMGAVGYEGRRDPRVRCYNKETGFHISSSAHSDVFLPGKLEFFAPKIVEAVLAARDGRVAIHARAARQPIAA